MDLKLTIAIMAANVRGAYSELSPMLCISCTATLALTTADLLFRFILEDTKAKIQSCRAGMKQNWDLNSCLASQASSHHAVEGKATHSV